jgi:hypothetical protein
MTCLPSTALCRKLVQYVIPSFLPCRLRPAEARSISTLHEWPCRQLVENPAKTTATGSETRTRGFSAHPKHMGSRGLGGFSR